MGYLARPIRLAKLRRRRKESVEAVTYNDCDSGRKSSSELMMLWIRHRICHCFLRMDFNRPSVSVDTLLSNKSLTTNI